MNFVTKQQFVEFARFYVNQFPGNPNFEDLYNRLVAFYGITEEKMDAVIEVMQRVETPQLTPQVATHEQMREALYATSKFFNYLERDEYPSNSMFFPQLVEQLRKKRLYFTIPDIYKILMKEWPQEDVPSYNTIRYYVLMSAKFIGTKPKESTKIYE